MNNKILVVDDESRIRKIIRDFLVREGYVVCEAEDGEAALDIFCSNNETASLCDNSVARTPVFGIIDKFRNKKTPKVFLGRPTSFFEKLFVLAKKSGQKLLRALFFRVC